MREMTVVIPTHNRAEVLRKALNSYKVQSIPELIRELIVVDDGSTDRSEDVVLESSAGCAFPIRYLRQGHKGPAAARNAGIREAQSELILFTDDDIIPGPDLVAEHAKWHAEYPLETTVVLGYVSWAPEVNPTPFMKWYGADGALFSYAHISGHREIDYKHFYTCNLSLSTEFVRDNGGFDEDFKVACYEDIELGYRLKKAGMRLLYNAKALAFHHQYISFDDACRRAGKATLAAEIFRRKEAGSNEAGTSQLRLILKKPLASVLSPVKNLMDCRLPLPWALYRAMFRIYR